MLTFAQMLRGVRPPPPPQGIGRVHKLESYSPDISVELLEARQKGAATQILETCDCILEAVKLGASSFHSISKRAGVSKGTVRLRMPMLVALRKVSVTETGQGKAATTVLLDRSLTMEEVLDYMSHIWAKSDKRCR